MRLKTGTFTIRSDCEFNDIMTLNDLIIWIKNRMDPIDWKCISHNLLNNRKKWHLRLTDLNSQNKEILVVPKNACLRGVNAMMFMGEKLVKSNVNEPQFSMCCGNGKFKVPFFKKPLPKKLIEYLTENTPEAKFFRKHSRSINAAFSFTSFGCNEIRFTDGAPGSLKVRGQIYHGIGKYFGPKNDCSQNYKPQFASIYFFDTANEFENRMDFSYFPNTKIGKKVQENVEKIMHEFSPFVKQFKSAIERSLNENIPDLQIVLRADLKPADAHKGMPYYSLCFLVSSKNNHI